MDEKVLIANRGEIALRISRSVREMGYVPVSVYSEADRLSLHVIFSDLAYFLGPSEPSQSYLDMEKIIKIAKESKARFIHPGYGFLAENPLFAKKVEEAGLVFIGPSSTVLALVGDKIEARKTAEYAGVPVIPGSKVIKDIDSAKTEARRIGFPLLIKAALGGGGKGMRVVKEEKELGSSFRLAQDESRTAFGEDSLFFEKYLENPRHVEIQIIADDYGNVVPLHERECSIQRRYQKIVEESPSPAITDRMRKDMMESAVAVIKEVGYKNAGTVEFLVEGDKFYFLEVNARLQVEHPVTEMRFGIDLVREQIRVSQGEKVDHLIGEKPLGHSIEARIYAEDPENNFFPSPGKIVWMREPGGPYIRVDSGIYSGFEVPVFYDPLLSKVIAWGENRKEALNRLLNALKEYKIAGITTNIPFHRSLLVNKEFVNGRYDINFLKRFAYSREVDTFALAVAGVVANMADLQGKEGESRVKEKVSLWKIQARKAALRGGDWEIL